MIIDIIAIFINTAVAGLLLTVIFYCRRLSKSIKVLRDSRTEMATLFAQFDDSISKASESIDALQDATQNTEDILKGKMEKANLIADDLSFMIERGNKMADQLEADLKQGRTTLAPKQEAEAQKELENDAGSGVRKLAGNRAATMQRSAKSPKPAAASKSSKPSPDTTASIESVLEQIANRKGKAKKAPKSATKSASSIRSKAEQELLDSLKSGR